MERKVSQHYVDNKQFYEEMIQFRAFCEAYTKEDRPPIPRSIGQKIMLICERLSYSRDFIRSPHREEMVLDAVENCIVYIRNFDPEKSKNPFAYFTQIAYYAFIRRAQKEKKSFMTKVSYAQNAGIEDVLEHAHTADSESGSDSTYSEFANHLSSYLAYSQNGQEWKPEPEDGEPKRKKRTTLAYQKKKKEEEEAAAQLELELNDPEIEDALRQQVGTPVEIMGDLVESEVNLLKELVDQIEEDEVDE